MVDQRGYEEGAAVRSAARGGNGTGPTAREDHGRRGGARGHRSDRAATPARCAVVAGE
ncbi:hypothetical protein [Haloactinospora alba]|uniref:hypothetical protein n=1 Tax=Haloactinospora alba TaxID=405555 RepID=UPI00147740A5|nr:hypothetical protein [Haloactinospora alba]